MEKYTFQKKITNSFLQWKENNKFSFRHMRRQSLVCYTDACWILLLFQLNFQFTVFVQNVKLIKALLTLANDVGEILAFQTLAFVYFWENMKNSRFLTHFWTPFNSAWDVSWVWTKAINWLKTTTQIATLLTKFAINEIQGTESGSI